MGPRIPFTADVESHKDVVKIALSGELDMATAPILAEHLRRSEERGAKAIVLDLRNVTFMDSTGLVACIEARARAAASGHRFMIVDPSIGPRRVFEITGTEFLLEEAPLLQPSSNGLAAHDSPFAHRDGGPDG